MKQPSISHERWLELKAETKFDTPAFLAVEAERKADALNGVRMGEYYERASRKHREGQGSAITITSSYNPWAQDWSEQHEA